MSWERQREAEERREAARMRAIAELRREEARPARQHTSEKQAFLDACPGYERAAATARTVQLGELYFAAVVIQSVWRGVLHRLVRKCVVIQAYWRGCATRMRRARGYYAKARRSLKMVRGMSGSRRRSARSADEAKAEESKA